MEYFGFIIYLILFFIVILISVKKYISAKDFIERIIYILFPIIYIVFGIIYSLDLYNIPSTLGWDKNISIDRWFDYISNYSSSIVGAVIGGVFVLLVTIKQINEQNYQYKQDKRIQNAPIFKYDISNKKQKPDKEVILCNGDGNIYSLFLNIENIGFNHARNIVIDISGDNIVSNYITKLDESQSILKKGNTILLQLIINYKFKKTNNKKNIYIKITYDDLLENNYEQVINISGEVTNTYDPSCCGRVFNILKCKIENEKCISKR